MSVKKFFSWFVMVSVIFGSFELLSYAGLWFLREHRFIQYYPLDVLSEPHTNALDELISGRADYVAHSAELGWTLKPNGKTDLYEANSMGIRSSTEYAMSPPSGVRRISTFGDSYTHGSDVSNEDTWQAQMERLGSNLEVLNFGVGGYGLDQAYLRYMNDGRQYGSHIVFLGYMSENLLRNVNCFRPFYVPQTGVPLAKPRFVLENEELVLVPNPMQTLDDYGRLRSRPRKTLSAIGADDYFYQAGLKSSIFDVSATFRLVKLTMFHLKPLPGDSVVSVNGYDEESEAFRVTRKIFDDFHKMAVEDGAVPVILFLPNKGDVSRFRSHHDKRYSSLLSYFDSVGYEYIDVMDAFGDARTDDLFIGHYSPVATELIAKYLLAHFDTR